MALKQTRQSLSHHLRTQQSHTGQKSQKYTLANRLGSVRSVLAIGGQQLAGELIYESIEDGGAGLSIGHLKARRRFGQRRSRHQKA